MQKLLPFLVLALVAIACHWMLVPVGFAILDSEWAVFPLWAESMRQGHWTVFPFQQNYGGGILTTLRALWVHLVNAIRGQDSLWAHNTFSYIVCPVLMSWSSYFLLGQYCTRRAALAVGLVCAVGFQCWVFQYSNDFYPAYYMLGCLLLGWRARFNNPFLDLSPRGLALAGILCGLLMYTSRATQIFMAAFFIPWPWAWNELKSLCRLENRWLKKLLYLGGVLICLGVYLEVFGREVGHWNGRVIKIDGKPNHQAGFLLVAMVWCFSRFQLLRFEHVKRAGILIAGYLVGFAPELVYQLSRGRLTSEMNLATQPFETSMRILAATPEALTFLVSGKQFFRGLSFTDEGIGRHISVFLLLIAMACFVERLVKDKKTKQPSLVPLFMVFVISLYSFCRIFTRVPEFAPPRYLFPLFPFIVVSLGVLWDRVWQLQGRRVIKAVLTAAFIAHCGHHMAARYRLTEVAAKSQRQEMAQEVVAQSKRLDVRVVISDDFWHANTYGLMSGGQPYFWANWRDWGDPRAKDLALHEQRVGVFLAKGSEAAKSGEVFLMGRRFRITPVAVVGERELFLGQAVGQ